MPLFFRALLQSTQFTGSLSRGHFWRYAGIHIGILASLFIIALTGCYLSGEFNPTIVRLSIAYGVFAMLTTLSAMVRRLNDAGQSSWKILLLLIPVYGHALLVVHLSMASKQYAGKQ